MLRCTYLISALITKPDDQFQGPIVVGYVEFTSVRTVEAVLDILPYARVDMATADPTEIAFHCRKIDRRAYEYGYITQGARLFRTDLPSLWHGTTSYVNIFP